MASNALLPILARRAAFSLARIIGLCAALAVATLTLILWLKGGPNVGQNLKLLGHYLPGFRVSPLGALLGGIETWVGVTLLSVGPAWLYFRGVLATLRSEGAEAVERDPEQALARLHPLWFGAAGGTFTAILLVAATAWLLIKHEPGRELGPHLGLLAHYLPGYSVSAGGLVPGAASAFGLSGVFCAVAAALYNGIVRRGGRR